MPRDPRDDPRAGDIVSINGVHHEIRLDGDMVWLQASSGGPLVTNRTSWADRRRTKNVTTVHLVDDN